MARLTKEERDDIRRWGVGRGDFTMARLLDDLDAADAQIEFEKGEVKRYWDACDALEDEAIRLREENDRLHAYGEAHAEAHVKAKDELAEVRKERAELRQLAMILYERMMEGDDLLNSDWALINKYGLVDEDGFSMRGREDDAS